MTRPAGRRDQHAAALTHNDRSQLDQIAPHLTYLENKLRAPPGGRLTSR